jgi:hypothetical protein
MSSSALSERRDEPNKMVWLVLATGVGFVLVSLLAKGDRPSASSANGRLEFVAEEYYDR